MRALLAIVSLAANAAAQTATPAPGIDRELARARGELIRAVNCDLRFVLDPTVEEVRGQIVLRFELRSEPPAAGVVVDFAGGSVSGMRVNGVNAGDLARIANHLLLPAALLDVGENELEAEFTSPVAATGTALTRYLDQATGRTYDYTLLVPADAHRLFPCFDQPDLKTVFRLTIEAPTEWQVVANGPLEDRTDSVGGRSTWSFAPTAPICTYLFAFAAGPFEVLESPVPLRAGADPEQPLRLFVRTEQIAYVDVVELCSMHERALQWLAEHFDHPYPFAKLDAVLIPGFPYGGMEHAGCIFYRETALAFDHEPTASELVRRSTLVYHEVAHQWFGNLVSFVWFDDLWLKEGFATFIAYRLLEQLEPEQRAWLRFLQYVKPRAYSIDATPGTTPIYQPLTNLGDAKSAYGAIVYNKAPAVLRELEARLGSDVFRAGLRAFITQFAFGNATWEDLVAALEKAHGRTLRGWSDRWILGPGLPRIRSSWTVDVDGDIASFAVEQRAVDGQTKTWPLRLEVLIGTDEGRRRVEVTMESARVEVAELVGAPAPDWVLLNPRDQAYGQTLLDPRSQRALLVAAPRERDPLVRAVMLAALRENLRAGELDPADWVETLLELLTVEKDPDSHAWVLQALDTSLLRYLAPDRSEPLRRRAEEILLEQLAAGERRLVLQVFRALARLGQDERSEHALTDAIRSRTLPGGLELGREDTYLAYAALLARGNGTLAAAALPRSGDVARYAYVAGAAAPDAETKARYFASYLAPAEPPEQWVAESLGFFHWPGQEALTLPYLGKALEQLAWVKEHRKIFFMPAWIDAFVNGHESRAALDTVERYLGERPDLPADVRGKILQSLDELRRVVLLRERWQ